MIYDFCIFFVKIYFQKKISLSCCKLLDGTIVNLLIHRNQSYETCLIKSFILNCILPNQFENKLESL